MTLPVTHDEQSALDRLYPSMKQTPAPAQQNTSVLGVSQQNSSTPKRAETAGEKLVSQARDEGIPIGQISDDVLSQALHAPDGLTNDEVNSYEPHGVYSLYEDLEREARSINDEEQLEILGKARVATDQAFKDFSVHPTRAKEIMTMARQYMNNPRDFNSIETMNANVMANLRAEYGRKTDALLAAGGKVSAELCRRIPEFGELLDAGLGSDEKFIRTCINAAKRRGWV